MRHGAIAATAAVLLSACGGGSVDADANGDGTVTGEEMSDAVADAGSDLKPQPGKYELAMEMLEFDAPGAPAQTAEMMRGLMDRTDEYCLTPEMADRGFAENFKENQQAGCEVTSFTLDGGRMDMAMTCSGEDGLSVSQIAMNGEVTPTTSDMTMEIEGTIPDLGSTRMKMAYNQRRIGDC
jgi:hypothetical protein